VAQIRSNGTTAANLAKLAARLGNGQSLRVGFLEGATYENPDGSTTPVGYVAALNNYGHGGTPPRPFFTNMVAEKSGEWPDALEAAMHATDNDPEAALSLLGEHIAGELRQAIIDTNDPPLSPVTIMLRSMRRADPSLVVTGRVVGEAAKRVAAGELLKDSTSTKPLVDTGQMLASIDYEVTVK